MAMIQLLGMKMKPREIEIMLAEVDRDGSGEVEYPECEILLYFTTLLRSSSNLSGPSHPTCRISGAM